MSANPSQQRMQQGHAARKAGRTAEALNHYRTAVEQDPESAEANSVYGLMLLQVGRADEAETPLRRAVEIAPSHAALRMNLAQWLTQQQRLDEAVGIVAGIVEDEPQQAWAWERLGELKARQRLFGEAAEYFRRATELQPHDPSLLFKRAQANFDAGATSEAERLLGEASRLAPGNAAILRLYTSIHESRADWVALDKAAQAWGAAQPREPAAWRALAKAQWETGYLRQAMQNFRYALGLGERNAQHLATYARLCVAALEFDSAAKALEEAEALNPDLGHMLSSKAILLMVSGRYDEAETYARRAVAASPNDPSAYMALARLTTGRLSREEIAALERLIEQKELRLADRVTAAFAFADCGEAQGDAKQAFIAYEHANRLALEHGRREGFNYNPSERRQQVDELIARFETVPGLGEQGTGRRAVFIVGMPRSGTTLIESVVSAHTQVLDCGERMAMRWILEQFLALAKPDSAIDGDTWLGWRKSYWQAVPEQPEIRAVTDSNPWNFDAIGMIARLFPDARIIHVRRNPVESGFPIFRNQFGKANQYANRLEDIGHYYGEYARLMAHWERVAAGRFTTVQYEDFVKDFDAAGPSLLAACGLDWEPGCRNFWESRRVIGTMSTMQVRRPLESCAIRAESYGDLLKPLENALSKAGVDLKTGEFRGNS